MNTEFSDNVLEKEETEIKEPRKWNVFLYNDDYTPLLFVIQVLMYVFGKSEEEAFLTAKNVEKNSKGIVGIYSKDIASTKVEKTLRMAAINEFPLKCTMEKEN